jgi:hypothetical protein
MGYPTEIQALDNPTDQQAMGHPAEIQALDNPPISKRPEIVQ